MKTLELSLNKRLLIVEYETEAQCLSAIECVKNGYNLNYPEKLEIICKGSELTEDIAKGFSKPVKSSHGEDGFINYLYESKEIVYSPAFVTALESFISAMKAAGYHWGENPVKEPPVIMHDDFNPWAMQAHDDRVNAWKESESRTFNPEKCIIFEIV